MAFTLGQFFSILRARWWVGVAVLLGVVGLTLTASLLWPKKYTAIASVVADSRPDPIASMMYGGIQSPTIIGTQIDILNSDRVAQRVVRNLKLAEIPQLREQWQISTEGQGTFEQWLVSLIKSQLEVTPSKESTVINISYSAGDPAFAAAAANAYVQAYVDTSLEMRVAPAKQFSSFFDARTKEARDKLEAAQAKLTAFQREKGIIATDERFDIENARLNELSTQLVTLEAVAADSTSKQAQAGSQSGDRLADVLNNPLVSGLRAELSRQEVRLGELSSRLGDAHPQVRELKANIQELRQKLDAETRRVISSVGITNTVNRSREAQTRAELQAQRAKVLQMRALRDEGQVLARDVESAQRNYEALQGRLTQTSLESQSEKTQVAVLTTATAPVLPSSPKVVLFTLVSVFVGGFLAVGVILLLEMTDRRVRGPQDIVLALELPVIGFMPKPGAKRRLRGNRLTAMQQNVLGLPSPAKGA